MEVLSGGDGDGGDGVGGVDGGGGGGGGAGKTINKAELFVTRWKTYDDKKCQLGTYQNN